MAVALAYIPATLSSVQPRWSTPAASPATPAITWLDCSAYNERCMSDAQNAGQAIPSHPNVAVREEIPADSPVANDRLRVWSAIRDLPHDALLKVYECGSTFSDDAPAVYCLREASDETLAGALAEGPLHADAVAELTVALREALDHLHRHSYTCGGIGPSDVHAVGDRTKLFPVRVKQGAAPADRSEDFRSLAMLAARAAGAPTVRAIADPRLRQIAAELTAQTQTVPASASSANAPVAEPSPSTVQPRMLVFAGLALAALIAFIVFRGERRVEETPAPAQARVTERPSAFETPQPQTPPVVNSRPASVTPKSTPKPVARTRNAEPVASTNAPGGWSVIAATYRNFDAAQRRANRLKAAYSGCVCSVYPDKGDGANYYVIVGSNMSRAAADQMRTRAVRSGLPRDSYVTKLASR